MLDISHVTKSFTRSRKAVDNVSFHVQRGEIFGLLGHNGAGKSTLLGVTLGMVYPDAGEVVIGGVSVQKDRATALRKVGAIFEAPAFYGYLSGWQNLKILAALSGFTDEKELRRLVELVNLTSRIDQRVETYSHGMRQRLALAQALAPMPEILLLDEPTDGLDPEGIREFRDFVRNLRDQHGLTILFNSHLLSEVELLCDRVAIIRQGKLLYTGDGTDLRQPHQQFALEAENLAALIPLLDRFHATLDGTTLTLPQNVDVADVLAAAIPAGLRLRALTPLKETLEELYLKVSAG